MLVGRRLLAAGGLGVALAWRAGAFQRDGHEQHGHRGQDAVRASGAGHPLRATHHGRFAVSGFGGDSALGDGARLRQPAARAADLFGGGGHQSSGVAHRAADHWALCHALLAALGGAAQERRTLHAQPFAHHAGLGLVNRVGRFEYGLRGFYGGYFDCRNPFQAPR